MRPRHRGEAAALVRPTASPVDRAALVLLGHVWPDMMT